MRGLSYQRNSIINKNDMFRNTGEAAPLLGRAGMRDGQRPDNEESRTGQNHSLTNNDLLKQMQGHKFIQSDGEERGLPGAVGPTSAMRGARAISNHHPEQINHLGASSSQSGVFNRRSQQPDYYQIMQSHHWQPVNEDEEFEKLLDQDSHEHIQ